MKISRGILVLINITMLNANKCYNKVSVNVTDMIIGLKMDTPIEVLDAYVETSGMCINEINNNNIKRQPEQIVPLNTINNICSEYSCKWCGTISETNKNCQACCNKCRCVGCPWNRGLTTNWYDVERLCDSCCVEPEIKCSAYINECYGCNLLIEGSKSCKTCCGECRCKGCNTNNQLSGWLKQLYGDSVCDECCHTRQLDPLQEIQIYFNINVCMDNVKPLNTTNIQYTNYKDMLYDFNNELHKCYQNKTQFINNWSLITSNKGMDLSLMMRDENYDLSTILFGYTGMEIQNAQVISYDSSERHKSTSHMLFYSAIGFIIISISAILSTAIVTKVLNKRKEQNEKLLHL